MLTFTPNNPGGKECLDSYGWGISVYKTPVFENIPKQLCKGSDYTLPTTSDNGLDGWWEKEFNNQQTTTYLFISNSYGKCQVEVTIEIIEPIMPEFSYLPPCFDLADKQAFLDSLPTTSDNGITGHWGFGDWFGQGNEMFFYPDDGQCIDEEFDGHVYGAFYKYSAQFNGILEEYCFSDVGNIHEFLANLPKTSDNGFHGTWELVEEITELDHKQCGEYRIRFKPSYTDCVFYKKLVVKICNCDR